MAYCTECGKENRSEARFCRFCGQAMEIEMIVNPLVDETFANRDLASDSKVPFHPDSDSSGPKSLPDDGQDQPFSDNSAMPQLTVEAAVPKQETSDSVTLSPCAIGDILHDRFCIIQLLSPQDNEGLLYQAEDIKGCRACQTVQSSPHLRFCEQCGAELLPYPIVQLIAVSVTPQQPGPEDFFEAGVFYQVQRSVSHAPVAPERRQYFAGYQSDTGQQREIDEDSVLVMQLAVLSETRSAPILGFFAVADGIGGHDAGEVASRTAIRSLAAGVLQRIMLAEMTGNLLSGEELAARLRECIMDANQAILNLRSQSANPTDMGCTLTAALLHDHQAIVANAGDSRTYLLHNGKLTQITQDHSMVARMVVNGVLRPEEIYTHERKNEIYRSLGDRANLEIDVFFVELSGGDRLMLCCDGVWEMVRDPLLEDVLLEHIDPQQACNRLVEMSNQAGGDDNISVVVVNIQ